MRLSSPFFTTSAKKRGGGGGGASENPEPSSPKVTCIGQVRVKTKRKKDKQFRSLSRRRSGDSSFRKTEHRRHQRWVHLPISACEALRAFNGCLLFPCCRGANPSSASCAGERGGDGCGTVLARWMVFSNAPAREIEAVGGGGGGDSAEEEEDDEDEMQRRCSRRHVFDDIEVRNGRIKVKGVEEDEEKGRVSICIPPKNALLLMRFRSDPVKMETVANRCLFDCEDEDDEEEEDEEIADAEGEEKGIFVSIMKSIEEPSIQIDEEIQGVELEDEEMESNMSSFEALLHVGGENEEDEEKENSERNDVVSDEEKEDEDEEEEEEEEEEESLPDCLLLMMCEPKLSMEVSKETWVRSADFIRWMPAKAAGGGGGCEHHQVTIKRRPSVDGAKAKTGVADVPAPARRSDRPPVQPARSSCSLPAASVAAVIERRLRGNGAGAFALSRCKSEPRTTAAAKLMPEACFGVGVGVGGAAG